MTESAQGAMITTPHVNIFEIIDEDTVEEREQLLSPDQMFAVLTAMTCEEVYLSDYKSEAIKVGETVVPAENVGKLTAKLYMEFTEQGRDYIDLLDNYCEQTSNLSAWAQEESWNVKSKDFGKDVRSYIAFLLVFGINKETAYMHNQVLKAFHQIIEKSQATVDNPISWSGIIKLIILFPITIPYYMFRRRCVKTMNSEKGKIALERIERMLHYCQLVEEENKEFTFSPEKLKTLEIQVDGDGFKLMDDGKVILQQE